MKILFISATNLGDGVLTTGALDHFIRTYPDAEITVACGPLLTSIFAAAPNVHRVISLKKEPYAGHWRKLARETMTQRWDIVVDFRNSLLSRLLFARHRHIWSRQNKDLHKVEQIAGVIGVTPPPAPHIWFDADALAFAKNLVPDGGPVLALGPAARWRGKTWPHENFSALAAQLTAADGILPGARVAIFGAPGEEAVCKAVLETIPADRRIDAIAKTSPVQAAAAIARSALYVGNDSGLTHTAAAVGVPTLGLFGPGYPTLYRPWGPHAAYVSTPETVEELTGYAGYRGRDVKDSLMRSLTVTAACAAAVDLWNKTR